MKQNEATEDQVQALIDAAKEVALVARKYQHLIDSLLTINAVRKLEKSLLDMGELRERL